MATAITIEQWAAHLKRMVRTGAIKKGLMTAALGLAKEGERHAMFGVTNKPGGLRVRTGALRDSLHGTAVTDSDGVNVILSSGKGPSGFGAVPYARIHEEGGPVDVRRHTRSVVYGRRVDPFQVGPYQMNMPPRPFLQPALEHIEPIADRVISDEIARVLGGGR